jgi:hypothetical protein
MFVHNPRFLKINTKEVLEQIGEIKNITACFCWENWDPSFQDNRFNRKLEPQGKLYNLKK